MMSQQIEEKKEGGGRHWLRPRWTQRWRGRRTSSNTFGEKEYSSGDGMLTSVWGPAQWHMLHTVSFNYPVSPTAQDKKHYRDYLLSLQHVLPCKYCRINLKKNLRKLPPHDRHFANRDSFSRYIYQLHELVNTMLHKKSNLSYETVRDRYEHFRARCGDKKKSNRRMPARHPLHGGRTLKKKESGCTEPLFKGHKARCVLHIVPQTVKGSSFKMDARCRKERVK